MHLTDVGVTVLNHELLYDLFAGDISTRLRSFQSENTNKYFQTKQITMRSQPNYFNVVVVVSHEISLVDLEGFYLPKYAFWTQNVLHLKSIST